MSGPAPGDAAAAGSSRLTAGIRLAGALHRGQTRKGSAVPYVLHPLAVAAIVVGQGGDEDEVIAALLHDGIEDGGGEPASVAIGERFGPRVLAIVLGCTDTDRTPKPPWRERKEAFVSGLRAASASVRLVVAADKLHNAGDTARDLASGGPGVWERFRGGRDGTLWYYDAVLAALADGWDHPILAELRDAVSALHRA